MLLIILLYFLLLLAVSRYASAGSNAFSFMRGEKKSPWLLVAFGMVGASISGVSFISVPGMVIHSGFSYLWVCFGFIFGYIAVAFLLLPLYYRHNVTTIYSLLKPLGPQAHKTGSTIFLIGKILAAGAKFYVPCYIISQFFDTTLPSSIVTSVIALVLLIMAWLYTRNGGIKTLVWTDCLQTLCMLFALGVIIVDVIHELPTTTVTPSALYTQILSDFSSGVNVSSILVSIISGAFIVIAMTGLDQDMMQKNLTCKSLRDAQKDMCLYGTLFLPINALFLLLGYLLVTLLHTMGAPLPSHPDNLLTNYALEHAPLFLLIGIMATSFSTVDSTLTALTTTYCTDIANSPEDTRLIHHTHFFMAILLALVVTVFSLFPGSSLIDLVYKLVSYTYGPLLGLFAYAILHQQPSRHPAIITILSPIITYFIFCLIQTIFGYSMGYELLIINGTLTFCGLKLSPKQK